MSDMTSNSVNSSDEGAFEKAEVPSLSDATPARNAEDQDPECRRLIQKLDEARKELLETSTRTRLLHTPLGSPRAKIVEVRDELAEQVFQILVQEGKQMTFLPAPGGIEDESELSLPQPEELEVDTDGVAQRHSDTKLQTGLSSVKLQARLRAISYDAQSVLNEQGVNTLYLALGFLKWHEARDAENARFAPLILLPVTLTRTSARERFKVAYSGEEIGTNLSLKERLKEESVELPDLPDIEDLSPEAYTSAVARRIEGMRGWEVLPNATVLGFFSFAKLMMYRDLDPDNWPLTQALCKHAIINGLLKDGFGDEAEPPWPEESQVDAIVDISATPHVVDADSSQMLAIAEVANGRNLVIHGPPGTGKSQTITNLIATAVRERKRVLFVAEKMAALNVVRSNLERVGLGQLCLELHSHKAKKKVVLEALEATFEFTPARSSSDPSLSDKLRAARDALNDYVRRTHTPLVPSALTPFSVFSKLAVLSGRGIPAPDFQLRAAQQWTASDIEESRRSVARLAAHVEAMGVPAHHPWRGVELDVVLPEDVERYAIRSRVLGTALEKLAERSAALATQAETSGSTFAEARRVAQLGRLLGTAPGFDPVAMGNDAWLQRRAALVRLAEHGKVHASRRLKLDPIVAPDAWDQEIVDIRRQFSAYGKSWFRWLRTEYRSAVRNFRTLFRGVAPKRLEVRLDVLNDLLTGQHARAQIRSFDQLGSAAFGTNWRRDESDWILLKRILQWEQEACSSDLPPNWRSSIRAISDRAAFAADAATLDEALGVHAPQVLRLVVDLRYNLKETLQQGDLDAVPLPLIRQRLESFASEAERLHQWTTWRLWSQGGRDKGLSDIVDRLADGRVAAALAVDVFDYACYENLSRQAFASHRDLAVFDGRSHESIIAEFRRLDAERLRLSRHEVATEHHGMIPRGGRELGELGILRREWRKKKKHLPLRKLISGAGRAMQLIKPVWMMSPMSLAQFVEPGAVSFDVALMDEASQIRPVEALGAIARCNQLVVVGDEKQLPPTSFFDRIIADESEPQEAEDFQAADVESILGLCSAQGMPDRMLRWHYRSQHESLIAVSNLEFYKKLFIVPSSHSDDIGLRFRKVNGVYDRGRTATNRIEAEEVARAVMEHARRYGSSERYPNGMTLGVGTFSVAQRDLILDVLEDLEKAHPEVEAFFKSDTAEPFFVKNLESIQGDERDVVFISVGYGPDADRYTSMYFGPLSHPGGERRLNVLISRARRRCEVFSSITAADIDLRRTQSIGVGVLRTFLQYAESGYLERAMPGEREIDSDFEADVGNALAALGYQVVHQVGVAGFFVDLGVRDAEVPGRYLIGIECDGAPYHSSRSARDRDRLREQVLRDRGWLIHRIWSPDWYRRRHAELQRVVAAIESSRSAPAHRDQGLAAPVSHLTQQLAADPITDSQSLEFSYTPRHSIPYVEADFRESVAAEPHELPLSTSLPILLRIVDIEGPIHEAEIGRRFATVLGKERAGNRIQDSVKAALIGAVTQGKLHREGAFYTRSTVGEIRPRDRSHTGSITLRSPEMLPPTEIRAALQLIVNDHVGVNPQDAITEAARTFGFQRTGSGLQQAIEEQLRMMLGNGRLQLKNGNRLYIAGEHT